MNTTRPGWASHGGPDAGFNLVGDGESMAVRNGSGTGPRAFTSADRGPFASPDPACGDTPPSYATMRAPSGRFRWK